MYDALVVGAGPAGLAIAAALRAEGLSVGGLAPAPPDSPWPNTYGIWCDELDGLGLGGTLGHRWDDTSAIMDSGEIALGRPYGLFDNARLQAALLERAAGVAWARGAVESAVHAPAHTAVLVRGGGELRARLVVDASGHRPALVRRPAARLAEQAAFGIMGTFAAPPVRAGQLVLMDYRTAHLPPEELAGPPTFLYAMDLGGGRHFVEETSLAHAPGLPMELLERRLRARLAWMGAEARGIEHVERCLFPMDSPLPDLRQPIFGYGGAASMVHPPTGYQVGSALRRAAPVARAVAAALARPAAGPAEAALAAWGALWPTARVRRRALYLFGLATLTRCDSARLQAFFETFFAQPRRVWAGYLSDTLGTGALLATMLSIFAAAPGPVRAALAGSALANRRALLAAALATPA